VNSRVGTYLINLASAKDRLVYMDAQLRAIGIDYVRIEGIDGKLLSLPVPGFDPVGYRLKHGRKFHPGEVGCYLSHMKAIRTFLNSDHTHALILEDDTKLPNDLVSVIDRALARAGDWDLLRLSTVNTGWRVPYRRLDADHHLAIALTRDKGAGAYVINRRCAERFLEALYPMRLAWDIAFDLEFFQGLKAVFVVPPPVDQNTGRKTQIQHFTDSSKYPAVRYVTVFPYRAWLETNRFVRRSLRLAALKWRERQAGSAKS
jgi:Glycosyltransferase involved in LPS biosynthesis